MTPPVVIGIDPGLANVGLAIVELKPTTERVRLVETICTEKSQRKRRIREADDEVRRGEEVFDRIVGAANQSGEVVAICAESLVGTQSARQARQVGMCNGLIVGLSRWYGRVPIEQASAVELKKAVTGRGKASKADVAYALCERYGLVFEHMDDHGADALGAVYACLETNTIRALRRRVA